MRKLTFSIFILALLLTGCASPNAPAQPPAPTLPRPPAPPTKFISGGCIKAAEPTPAAETPSVFPPVSAQDYVIGPENAAATIIEYGDFQ